MLLTRMVIADLAPGYKSVSAQNEQPKPKMNGLEMAT